MKPKTPRKQNDPEVTYTASTVKQLLQRLTKVETAVAMVKVTLAHQIAGNDRKAQRRLFLDWQRMEEEASSEELSKLDWVEKAMKNLDQGVPFRFDT